MLGLGIDSFTGTRLRDSRSILAVFYAAWCPFCRSFLTIFEKTMKDRNDPLAALIDISDVNSPLWDTFQVKIVPTLVGFKNGATVVRKDGVAGAGLQPQELLDALRTMEEQ